jgi:hypothetical protein
MRKLIATSLLVAFSIAAFAQSTKWIVGLESTITSSSIRQSSGYDIYESQTGYGAAVTVSYQLTPYLWLSSGLGLERKGEKLDDVTFFGTGDFVEITTDVHNNFDYLILPIKASFQTRGRVKAYVKGGVFMGYLLKFSEKWDKDFHEGGYPISETASDFNRIDGGLVVGVGTYIPIYHRMTLDVGVVENWGLCNLLKPESKGSLKTSSWGLIVGFRYAL